MYQAMITKDQKLKHLAEYTFPAAKLLAEGEHR